jgi:uncharacterized membrane protein
MKTNVHFLSYLAQILVRSVSDKCCRENANTHFIFNGLFFESLFVYEICGKIMWSRAGNR